ncbi:MAG: hypothetical protein D4R67_06050 [Bacteroidetes bacterium]|nr:MAG: hypothetical protein D4R67_06050 [Bacteroidota bacterium]
MCTRFNAFVLLLLFLLFTLIYFTSCSNARRTTCKTDRAYNHHSLKKNRSNYAFKYGYKQIPVRKPYVLKNRRK